MALDTKGCQETVTALMRVPMQRLIALLLLNAYNKESYKKICDNESSFLIITCPDN